MPGMGGNDQAAIDILWMIVRGCATLFIAVLGMMLCTTVGSLAYPVGGVGAIVGATVGTLVFLTIGCCATGFWKDLIPADAGSTLISHLVPAPITRALGGHKPFTLLLTVEEVLNLNVQTSVPWRKPDLYVELYCGNNPVKSTCVRKDGVWHEQFKLHVAASDESIMILVKDQEIFSYSNVGFKSISVKEDIIQTGFPKKKRFLLEAGEKDLLRWSGDDAALYLSFEEFNEGPAVSRKSVGGTKLASKKFAESAHQYGSTKRDTPVMLLSQQGFRPDVP